MQRQVVLKIRSWETNCNKNMRFFSASDSGEEPRKVKNSTAQHQCDTASAYAGAVALFRVSFLPNSNDNILSSRLDLTIL